MDANDVLALGLGVTPPWKLVGQRLDTSTQPNQLHIEIAAERGALFPCPVCGKASKAHDFAEFTWRHLNFFQHHCFITAKVPRTDCPEHGVLRINVPWAREGSRFTLLFEQVAMMLVREMPVLAAARIIGITDQRLWRIVEHYVGKAVQRLDLTRLKAIGLDETAAKRGQTYVTVFIDLDAKDKPVVFVTPGRGKETVAQFEAFLAEHGGVPSRIVEVVCDMSGAFLAAVGADLRSAPPSPSTGSTSCRCSPRRSTTSAAPRPKRPSCPRPCAGPSSSAPTAASPMPRPRLSPNSKRRAC